MKNPTHLGEGWKTYLTFEEESCIVEGLYFLERCGYSFDINDVLNLIKTYFKTNKNWKTENLVKAKATDLS